MKVGLIGAGRIGRFHGRTLAEHPAVTGLTVIDADRALAGEVARELAVAAADTVDELLAEVEAVVICSSTDTHARLILRSIDAGVPVFCEKPIAVDLESTRRVVAKVASADVPLQMGFQRRFNPGFRRARDLVASGDLGTLYLLRMATHEPDPPSQDYLRMAGGAWLDMHHNDFDTARFVTGQEVEEVYAHGVTLGADRLAGEPDTTAALLEFSGGALGIMTGSRHHPLGRDVRMEIIGSTDSVVVGYDDRTQLRSLEPEVEPPAGAPYEFLDRFAEAYRAEIDFFLSVARGRAESPCTSDDAMAALEIAEAARLSAAEHRPVRLDEIR